MTLLPSDRQRLAELHKRIIRAETSDELDAVAADCDRIVADLGPLPALTNAFVSKCKLLFELERDASE